MKTEYHDLLKMICLALLGVILAAVCTMASSAIAEKVMCICPEGQFVRVRVSPSRNAAEWGKLHSGDEVDAAGMDSGYLQIKYDGRMAYADARYFEAADGGFYIVSANGRVAKRKAPGGEKSGWLNPGVRIQVMGWRYDSDGTRWARAYGGVYIRHDFLTREAAN